MLTEVEIFKENLDVSRVTLVITILMAVTTVVLSALTMAFQRSHNKKTVKPICSLRKINELGKTTVLVKNSGLGPMKNCCISIHNPEEINIVFNTLYNYTLMPNETIEICNCHIIESETLNTISATVTYEDLYDQKYEQLTGFQSL